MFFSAWALNAQTLQKGVVKEYREENNKRPLPGVEVEITNAGSVVSDKKGDFLLEFRTFKPGQRVNVRRIEKNGYEIFNKDALEQWNINPDEPFTIVMVKRELFKQIRDNYSRISSQSYAEQYEIEKAALDKERLEGKISEERHRTELEELSNWYDEQLSNLDNYVDRFARIDLNVLDKEERLIIELVKEGKLDEAIAKYNKNKLVDLFESESKEKELLSEAVRTLGNLKREKETSILGIWAKIQRMLDTYILKGGKDSYVIISDILERVAKADTSNLYILSKCITYAGNINHVQLQKSLYELCDITSIEDEYYRNILSLGYSNTLVILGEYETAIPYVKNVIASAEKENNVELIFQGISHLLTIYEFTLQVDKFIETFNELLEYANDESKYSMISDYFKSNLHQDIASHYDKIGDYVNSNKQLNISYDITRNIYLADPDIKNLRDYVNAAVSLGVSYNNIGDVENCIRLLKEVKALIEDAGMSQHPNFIYEYYVSLKHIGISYFGSGDYVDCEEYFRTALSLIETTPGDLFIIEEKTDMYNNLGYLYYSTGQFEKSEQMYKTALDICYEPYLQNPNKYILHIYYVQINMSSLYLAIGDNENTIRYGKDALASCELIYSVYPDMIADNYVLTLRNMAQAAANMGDADYASELLEKALLIKPGDSVTLEMMNAVVK